MQFLKQHETDADKNYYWHRTKDGTIYATDSEIDSNNLPEFFFNGENDIFHKGQHGLYANFILK